MKYSTGALESKKKLTDFIYKPDKANWKGGTRYSAKDIEDQSKVGICTSISVTQQARKARGIKYSADFQYLIQKKFVDKNWSEGSATAHGPYVAYKYGLLPEKYWKHTTFADRKKGYKHYIKKLQAIPDAEIQRLLKIAAKHKIVGYQRIPISRDTLANAIDESEAGIITRMVVDDQWWTDPIEPIRKAIRPISGHAITASNYAGGSVRVANTWGCYSDDTEILTKDGWKLFKDVSKNEIVATLNTNGHKIQYQKISDRQAYDFSGDLYHYDYDNIDLLVTPNHNMFIGDRSNNWKKVRAEDIKHKNFKITKTGNWNGDKVSSFVIGEKEIDINTWVEFMGYFISEGHTSSLSVKRPKRKYLDAKSGKIYNKKESTDTSYIIGVSQVKKESKEIMEKCMAKLPFGIARTKNGWQFSSKEAYSYLSKLGKSYEKYVPSEIKSLPKEQLSIFLDALILGDGTRRGKSTVYYTSSKRLADDVQEIALKCGYCGDIYEDNRIGRKQSGGVTRHINYQVVIKKHRKITTPKGGYVPDMKPYKGKVYCVTVPNGIIYVRRNGKGAWCGNSDWADKGTAYYLFKDNPPTEAYIVYYNEPTKTLAKQLKSKEGIWFKVKKFISNL